MAKFEPEHDPEEPNRYYLMVDDKFDIRILRTDEGVIVDVYAYDGMEAVASTYAFDSDVEKEVYEENALHNPGKQYNKNTNNKG